MTKCDYCGIESENPKGYNRNFCDSCVSDKEIGIPATVEYVQLPTIRVTKSQIKELERRRILPYEKPDGGYYVGRMGENGKIQERWPNYA